MSALVKWIIGAVIGVIIVIVTFIQIDPKINNEQGVEINSSIVEGKIEVKIEGQVAHPGTYLISENSTVDDLVELAGGFLSSADLDAINTYLSLENVSLVYVPMISGYSQNCVIDPDAKKINLNTASASELEEVNGISETLANRIVEYRLENGSFESLEELMEVVGIGIVTYEKIRDSFTLR